MTGDPQNATTCAAAKTCVTDYLTVFGKPDHAWLFFDSQELGQISEEPRASLNALTHIQEIVRGQLPSLKALKSE